MGINLVHHVWPPPIEPLKEEEAPGAKEKEDQDQDKGKGKGRVEGVEHPKSHGELTQLADDGTVPEIWMSKGGGDDPSAGGSNGAGRP
jgi:hypothetical protein